MIDSFDICSCCMLSSIKPQIDVVWKTLPLQLTFQTHHCLNPRLSWENSSKKWQDSQKGMRDKIHSICIIANDRFFMGINELNIHNRIAVNGSNTGPSLLYKANVISSISLKYNWNIVFAAWILFLNFSNVSTARDNSSGWNFKVQRTVIFPVVQCHILVFTVCKNCIH
jgi:hypothetical protein